ncbi:MAG: hypothetical protein ACE14M_07735 [Terriglobales bacterium]
MRAESTTSGPNVATPYVRPTGIAAPQSTSRQLEWIALLVALIAVFSMWYYVHNVLIPYQQADAVRTAQPRGNQSDLYPAWLASRELLVHGRDPYSLEVTLDIQRGYWGRTLDRPSDPKDQARFAYPLYVAFLLAPAVLGSFHTVPALLVATLLAGLAAALVRGQCCAHRVCAIGDIVYARVIWVFSYNPPQSRSSEYVKARAKSA